MFEAAGKRGNGVERSVLFESVARWMQLSLVSGSVLVGTLCFALGASLVPLTMAGAPAQFARAAERVLLTVSE